MNRFVFSKKSNEPELPACITPELADMSIRISTDGYPETGALYYEGTIRAFVIERLPHQQLVERLPELLVTPSFIYQPSTETLRVELINASVI